MRMKCTPSPTDDNVSFAATEFVWATAEAIAAHDEIAPKISEFLKKGCVHRVLDLGCGNGAFTSRLQSEGFEATGCDLSASGIALARQHFPGVHFFSHDLALPLTGDHESRYDAVVSVEVVEHLLLPRLMISNALAALRPGGLFIVTTPFHGYWKNLALAIFNKFDDHWHPLRDFGHVKFFSKATIWQLLLEQGLQPEQFLRIGRIPPLARTMIVVARKPE